MNVSGTVAKQLSGAVVDKNRSFIPIQAVTETITSGTELLIYKAPKVFLSEAASKSGKGLFEVAVDERTGRIVHVFYKFIKPVK